MSELLQTVRNKDTNKLQSVNFINAAEDIDSKKKSTRQKGKNTIPKSVRYDLENALVGLCDVWFEEIKPYLVSNNIKVHGDAGGDLKRSPASPDCSHVDPGRPNHLQRMFASCVDSSLTRRTASKAPYRRPLVQQLPLVLTENPIAMQIQRHNEKKETVRKPRKRRKCYPQPTQPTQLTSRLCRTYSKQQCTGVYATMKPVGKIPIRNMTKHSQQKKKIHTLDASTQTEEPIKGLKNSAKEITKNNPKLSKFARCPATTNIFLPKQNKDRAETPLFKDDLVNIIAGKHDKILKVLYTSPRKEEHPSIMNLFSPFEARRKPKRRGTIPPWK